MLEVKLKVTDKHNQSTLYHHACTHRPNHTPMSLWAYTCNKGGRGVSAIEARGRSSPHFPTPLTRQQQVWRPSGMQLPSSESVLCDRDNSKSEGRSELQGKRRRA